MRLADLQGRPLRDLRISVTDRCNFRCVYCMPQQIFGVDYPFLKREELLTFEEIDRLARIFVGLGVEKIRLTGGEPLMRRDIEILLEMLSCIPGIDLTMTTNGSLLPHKARGLRDAGLKRISVSLDSLDHEIFATMNGLEYPVERVLEGIEAAHAVGLMPIKINMVVKRGVNDGSILSMASRFRNRGHILRFIEYMDVGNTNGWRLDEVVPASAIINIVDDQYPLEAIEPNYYGEVVRRYRYKDGRGEIGVVASVTQPFCADCTRARLSAKGTLYTCLFASSATDLRELLRSGATDDEIAAIVASVWSQRSDRYSEIRSPDTARMPKVEMSYIGG
ncbi:MAG TPA: GTP 3',8-cyclase MoaA [Anaerolineae bacterium]|nr:GTP 3',8-cyclase MoaA [Anaerolineae bacterium]